MTDTERFELKACVFEQMTGLPAPGKDMPPDYSGNYEARLAAFSILDEIYGNMFSILIEAITKCLKESYSELELRLKDDCTEMLIRFMQQSFAEPLTGVPVYVWDKFKKEYPTTAADLESLLER